MPKQNPEQTVFIITGMHRSGTSLTASILQSAGVHIGRRLMDSTEFNQKGYFENLDFFEFHLDAFRSLSVNIDGWTLQDNLEIEDQFVDRAKELIEKNSLSSIWGWKEPRTTLFLEFWAKLLPEAKFLLVYRSPWEVADSLYRRQDEIFQAQPELAIKYWQHYNQKILNFYNQEQHRCLLTNLHTIIQNQTAYIDTINQKFNVNLSYPAPTAYDPTLLKTEISSNSQKPTLIDYYFPEAIELYQELEGRAWHPEQAPDFSWQDLLKPSLYRSWVFQDWASGRRLEQENKSLKAQLQEQQAEVQEAQLIKTELEQTKAQLKTAEALLDQSQSQLHETEIVLEKSQTQLQRTESVLQQSHTQLNQTRTELETAKTQLSQAQFDVMRYQSQLHQTQEELEYYELHRQDWETSQSQLYESEVSLSQLMMELQQTQKREERFQIQLHQTLEELEQTTTQLYRDREALQQATHQVKQLKRDLKRSNSQLYQVQGELDLYHSQLEQSVLELEQEQAKYGFEMEQKQTDLTQTQSDLHQTQRDLKQKQAQIHQLQTELKRSQAQLHELQVELAQSQAQLEQMQERQRLEQTMAEDPKQQSNLDYNLLVWDAWNAYRNGKLPLMKQHLQQALKLTKTSPSEIILTWLETFSKLSLAQGFELDSHSLTNSEEWQQLMRQIMVKKTMPLPLIKRYPSIPEPPESEPIALSGTADPNLN